MKGLCYINAVLIIAPGYIVSQCELNFYLKEVSMPSTGEICQTAGIYMVLNHNIFHPQEIIMVEGITFPPCSECKQKVAYLLKEKAKH